MENKRVYVVTVGCFDCFHFGHEVLINHMLETGNYLLIGVHDDESIYKNKKMRVAQSFALRKQLVSQFSPQIEVFDVTEADPTNALIATYNRHKKLCDEQGIPTEWRYMRGQDMPNFPGRKFVESVMRVVWHNYTNAVSSTMIRNEIIPLSGSLVRFAKERTINDSLLNLLERTALMDHKLVVSYLLDAVDRSVGENSPSNSTQNSPRASPSELPLTDSQQDTATVSRSGSIYKFKETIEQPSSLKLPSSRSDTALLLKVDPPPQDSVSNISPRGGASPNTPREQVLVEIISALFTLFQKRKDETPDTTPSTSLPALAALSLHQS